MSRRTFLGATAMTLLASRDHFGVRPSSDRLARLLGVGDTAVAQPATSQRTRLALAAVVPVSPLPYQMQASCELSQDFFQTDAVVIADGDQVLPYQAADGSVGALVVTANTINNLVRDATQTSGWSYQQLPVPLLQGDSFDAAVVTDASGTPRMVAMFDLGDFQAAMPYVWDASTSTFDAQQLYSVVGATASLLQANQTRAGAYFYAWLQTDSTTGAQDVVVWQPEVVGGVQAEPFVAVSLPASPAVEDLIVLHADVGDPDAVGYIYWRVDPQGDGNGELAVATQVAGGTYQVGGTIANGFEQLLAAGWATDVNLETPWLLAQDINDIVQSVQPADDVDASIGPFSGTLASGEMAVWFQDDLMALVFVDQGTAATSTEWFDPDTGSGFTQPIPLSAGVSQVLNLTADPTEGTLFVVNADLTLAVWSKDPVSGWSQTPIHQAATTTEQLESWRVQLTVLDANQNPVKFCGVQVTSDRDTGFWQPSGSTIALTNQPVSMSTDLNGELTFAIPATDLDAPALTVQAYPDHTASGPAFPVTIDIDVHQYLAGSGILTDLPTPMTGASMLAAVDASGTPLFPVLAGLSGDDQTNGANAAAAAINQMVNAGFGATPGPADPTSFTFDMSGPVPTWTTSAAPSGVVIPAASVGDIWSDASHDIDSACRGIRNGVIKVATTVGNWVQDEADAAYHWSVDMYVDLENDISNAVNVVITDMRDAFHAVAGFFQALGADIESGLEWLAHNVMELLKDVVANAEVIEGWLAAAPAQMTTLLADAQADIVNWLDNLENNADTALAQLQSDIGGTTTFGESSQRDEPSAYTGSSDITSALSAVETANKWINRIDGRWLIHKLFHHIDAAPKPATDPNLLPLITSIATDFQTVLTNAANILDNLFDGFKDLFPTKAGYDGATIYDFLGVLTNLVNDGVAIITAIVDAVFSYLEYVVSQFAAALDYTVSFSGLIGDILGPLGLSGSLTAAQIASLCFAFPATLLAKVSGVGSLFPTANPAAAATAAATSDPWKTGLLIVTTVAQTIWGFNDLVIDQSKTESPQPSPNEVAQLIDFLGPLTIWCAGWPGASNQDGTTPPPFTTPVTGGTEAQTKMLKAVAWLGLVDPISAAANHLLGANDAQPANTPTTSSWTSYISPVVNSLVSIAITIVGTIYNYDAAKADSVKAAGILGNISNIAAPFPQPWINDPNESVPIAIKYVLDIGGNLGAAISDMVTALDA